MTSRSADVLVIGGGIIGSAIAWEVALRGADVVVVESGRPGREASWAAGGMLAPLAESPGTGAFLELGLASLERYPSWVERLESLSGASVGLERAGKIWVAFDAAQAAHLRGVASAWLAAGHPVEWLGARDCRLLEPALSDQVAGGILITADYRVDNRLLVEALVSAASAAGAEFRTGQTAAELRAAAGEVVLRSGERIAAAAVVLAAGAWSGELKGLPTRLPVRPVKGQMLALCGAEVRITRTLLTHACYIVPRANGQLVVGSTMEEAGFDRRPTVGGIHSLLGAATEAVPRLAGATPGELWAGLRPATPDDLPILGPDPLAPGICYATGHFRNGILLAPITAEIVADLLTGRTAPVDLSPFSVRRFREP